MIMHNPPNPTAAGASQTDKKHVLVILDEYASSFCHYVNPKGGSGQSQLISHSTLKKVIEFLKFKYYTPQFLFGNACLPDSYELELSQIEHVRIVPVSHPKAYPNSIIVINPDEYRVPGVLGNISAEVLILRILKQDVARLAEIVTPILDKCKRLNISLVEIEDYNDEDIRQYRKQLDLISKSLANCYKEKQAVEVNCLTDRLMLRQMNNCNAGITHFAIAPDGRFYTCPAFYYCGDSSIGDIEGEDNFPNSHLLDIKYSPICSVCDAFHCKRCVFLNKKLTLEVNTPSWQQCKIAHAERDSSRFLLSMIDWPIPEITYDDPFILVKEKDKSKG